MVQSCGAFVEASRVPGIAEPEALKVEVMAELVAKCAQKCSRRCDLLTHRRSHPHADGHRRGVIVAEKLDGRGFADAQWPRREDAHAARRYFVELGGASKEQATVSTDFRGNSCTHRFFNRRSDPRQVVAGG